MTNRNKSYLMENLEEVLRLEIKTDPEAVRSSAISSISIGGARASASSR